MPSRPMASRPSGGLWHAAVDPRGRGSAAARMRLRTAMAGTFAPATAVQRRIHVYSQGVHKVPQSVDNPGGVLKPTVLIGLHGSPPRPASARAKSRAGHSDTSLSRATGLLAGRIVWNEREPAALRDKGFFDRRLPSSRGTSRPLWRASGHQMPVTTVSDESAHPVTAPGQRPAHHGRYRTGRQSGTARSTPRRPVPSVPASQPSTSKRRPAGKSHTARVYQGSHRAAASRRARSAACASRSPRRVFSRWTSNRCRVIFGMRLTNQPGPFARARTRSLPLRVPASLRLARPVAAWGACSQNPDVPWADAARAVCPQAPRGPLNRLACLCSAEQDQRNLRCPARAAAGTAPTGGTPVARRPQSPSQ